ncbi:SDR family oxidoreductase [Streptomyces sp. HNM0574]|uniref:SDR family oxidoreductase n=1 Tax=Streptomyces sp. HNM0574 TaxID=2714954 RepID=UPI001F10B5B2|nr:SDR family oxidoreductase [Streptomyces sp. HNM0574]
MNSAAPGDTAPEDRAPVALVTGAGSGIGRAVARELARGGWTVVLAGRRREALAETAALVAEDGRGAGDGESGDGHVTGGTTDTVPADVTDPGSVHALFTEVRERHGRLDLLFNNAGRFSASVPLEELTFEEWRATVDVNLNGAFLCAQSAFRLMKEQRPQGGRIVNNGSISAHVPRPQSAAYTATKHAMTGLTKSLSLDGRPYRIACGQIDVGNAATELTARMREGIPQADGSVRAEPMMDAADVARTVRHMAELPLDANVQFATVMATTMPYIGRG